MGKSGYWDITFGIPNTNEAFLIRIHDGQISTHDIMDEGVPPLSYAYFITDLSYITFDSPEILKMAMNLTKLYPSENWQTGYSFGLSKSIEKDIILIKIIGWDQGENKMIQIKFDARTGEVVQ